MDYTLARFFCLHFDVAYLLYCSCFIIILYLPITYRFLCNVVCAYVTLWWVSRFDVFVVGKTTRFFTFIHSLLSWFPVAPGPITVFISNFRQIRIVRLSLYSSRVQVPIMFVYMKFLIWREVWRYLGSVDEIQMNHQSNRRISNIPHSVSHLLIICRIVTIR